MQFPPLDIGKKLWKNIPVELQLLASKKNMLKYDIEKREKGNVRRTEEEATGVIVPSVSVCN